MIPKIIWQTHELPYNQLPTFQKNIIKTWKNLNPGWEHRYVDAEERSKQVKEYDHLLHNYYLLVGKVHQADIWRSIAIYRDGGVYADMDSICVISIDKAIESDYKGEQIMCSPIGFQNSGVNNSNFGAIKNSKIMKLIIDTYILKYESCDIEELRSFEHGYPETVLFSKVVQENKKLVYFNKEYFNHAEEYKTNFDNNWTHS